MAGSSLAGLKRIFFDSIFERSYWTWRKHPLIVVPSMLGTAISVIEQSIVTLGVMVLLISLATRGLLSGFLSQLNQQGQDLNFLKIGKTNVLNSSNGGTRKPASALK